MNKILILFFALFLTIFSINAQQCENLEITKTDPTCIDAETILKAEFLNTGFHTTTSYALNGDFPCPPIQADPTPANISPDDAWAPIIFNIGFTFCFYGNMYDQVIVSGNGVVSFDLGIVEDFLATGSSLFHVWNTNAALDLPSPQLQPNSIFGVYTDPNPASSPNPTETIKFDLVNGDDPGNRVFVIEYNVPMFSCGSEFLHSRIKLYETSNVIDIEILEKGRCDGWENSIGIAGIQNKSATLATTVPGRTNADGGWWVNGDPAYGGDEANQELWRFIPDGNELGYAFKWYQDINDGSGWQELTTDLIDPQEIAVTLTTDTSFNARLTYNTECSYLPITIEQTLDVILPTSPEIHAPLDKTLCETTFELGTAIFDLNSMDEILVDYPVADWSDYLVTYHISQADADTNTAAISPANLYVASDNTIIYARAEKVTDSTCFDTISFTLYVKPIDDTTFTYPQSIYCTVVEANPMPENAIVGAFEITNGGVIDSVTGEIDLSGSGLGSDDTGIFTIRHFTTGTDCPNATEVTLSISITEDATFDFPTDICHDDIDPQAFDVITAGGDFTVNNGASISTDGILNLSTTTPGSVYTIVYSFNTGGDCPSSETKQIAVHEIPNATGLTIPFSVCDNGDGTADFDLTTIESDVIGSQSGVEITFHLTEDDSNNNANSIDTGVPARLEDNVWARVENTNGCFSVVEIELIVDNCYTVLPGGFSPSSDNPENQTFNTDTLYKRYPNYTVDIYNLNGRLVYHGDQSKDSWNGKVENEGDLLPAGTYYYILKLNEEQDLTYTGWVYLQK